MVAIREVTPKEAALLIFEDIRTDAAKSAKVTRQGDSFRTGNYACHQVYETPLSGSLGVIDSEFRRRVYVPLGIEVVAMSVDDVPADAWTLNHLGNLINRGH